MIHISTPHFNLSQICACGECFRMTFTDENTCRIIARDRSLLVAGKEGSYDFHCSKEEFEGFWNHYFDLDTDYQFFIDNADTQDDYLQNAITLGNGIRILNQDLWEMIVSFLISQQNNITRIRRCIENISQAYGEEKFDSLGNPYYAFPRPEALAHLEDNDLMQHNLGYRSKYVVRAAKSVVNGEIDLEQIGQMRYKDAKEELLKFYGVGVKVAECICLFALHHLDAFPIDTHINQALKNHYPKGFPIRKYKGFRGVLQQYIFYYELIGTPGNLP